MTRSRNCFYKAESKHGIFCRTLSPAEHRCWDCSLQGARSGGGQARKACWEALQGTFGEACKLRPGRGRTALEARASDPAKPPGERPPPLLPLHHTHTFALLPCSCPELWARLRGSFPAGPTSWALVTPESLGKFSWLPLPSSVSHLSWS